MTYKMGVVGKVDDETLKIWFDGDATAQRRLDATTFAGSNNEIAFCAMSASWNLKKGKERPRAYATSHRRVTFELGLSSPGRCGSVEQT